MVWSPLVNSWNFQDKYVFNKVWSLQTQPSPSQVNSWNFLGKYGFNKVDHFKLNLVHPKWTFETSLSSMDSLENESFKLKPWTTHALVARPFHYNSLCKFNYCDKLNLVLANLVKPLLLCLLLCMFSSLVCLFARMLVYFVIVFQCIDCTESNDLLWRECDFFTNFKRQVTHHKPPIILYMHSSVFQ